MSYASKFSDHGKCLKQALGAGETIVIELPVFNADHTLIGHIDLLAYETDGHLVVWDYKPQWLRTDWSPDSDADISRSFIQFVPQIAAYALTLMQQLGLKGVTCGIYNSAGTWEFDPVKVIETLNSDFPDAPFPWKKFKHLDIYARSTSNSPDYVPLGMGEFYEHFDAELIQELLAKGIDVDPQVVAGVGRNRDGEVIWLDEARLDHIYVKHAQQFEDRLEVARDRASICNFILNAIKSYPIIEILPGQGAETQIYVYNIKTSHGWEKLEVLVLMDLGWIISAWPRDVV